MRKVLIGIALGAVAASAWGAARGVVAELFTATW
jgi:hypothetical protein